MPCAASAERKEVNTEKRFGQVFTPPELVRTILDFAGYVDGNDLIRKHVIDNSCGDGAFLVEVVRRYCSEYARGGGGKAELARLLGKYVHGIEIDGEAHRACIRNLDALVAELGIPKVTWDVRLADSLSMSDFNGRMDFVVGNPPYVRVHNLDDDFARVKRYRFCGDGMTDLYLVFYEIGLQMLSSRGRLCYIAPSSWMTSMAGRNMRAYLRESGRLRGIADLGHFQPFKATTYTAIVLLENGQRAECFSYGVYDISCGVREVDVLSYDEAFFDGALFLGDRETLRWFREIKTARVPSRVEVKNGFATLADSVFIADVFPFAAFTIPVVKASTGKWRKAFFPYDANGRPLSSATVFADRDVADYLNARKDTLLKGRREEACPDWFLYGRTQALRDVSRRKYAVNTVVRDVASVKFNVAPEGTGVYGGLYILSDVPERRLREVLLCDSFIRYVAALGKYKSGGYYTFNSRELEQYLNFSLRDLTQSRGSCAQHRQMRLSFDDGQEETK